MIPSRFKQFLYLFAMSNDLLPLCFCHLFDYLFSTHVVFDYRCLVSLQRPVDLATSYLLTHFTCASCWAIGGTMCSIIGTKYKICLSFCNIRLFTSLTSGRFRGFLEKNAYTHVTLFGNFSGPVCSTDLVKVSKDAANLLVCTRKKNFCLGSAGFSWVTL